VAADHVCWDDTSAGRWGVCFGDNVTGFVVGGVGVGGLPYETPGVCVAPPNGRGGDQGAGDCCGLAFGVGLV
jgi:hypothetical protein